MMSGKRKVLKPDQSVEEGTSSRQANLSLLSSPCHGNTVLLGLNELRKEGTLCDYSLVAENTTLKVHKAVLAACSDYFRVMMTGDMREAREDSVHLHWVSAAGLQAVVDFAYTGKLELGIENVEEVLAAASHLQMTDVVRLCCEYLEMAITEENCVDILNLAELYSLLQMKEQAMLFILEHFESISTADQFNSLNHTQMAALLDRNHLKVTSEYHLFLIVLSWIRHRPQQREPQVAQLMSRVRLPLLTGEELVEKVSQEEIMKCNTECNRLLTEAKDYHIVVGKQPLLQSPRTQIRSDQKSIMMIHGENVDSYNLVTKKHTFLKDATIPLYNPCVCVIDNFMYTCGGKYDNNSHNEIATARCFRYDPRFDTWYELASMTEARKDFVMVAYKGALYAIAGQDENILICSMECFQVAKNEWEMKVALPNASVGSAGAVCNDLIYLSGGQLFDGYTGKLMCYNPSEDKWTQKAPMIAPRGNHIMEHVNGRLFVIGGNVEDSYGFAVPTISIEIYSPAVDQWSRSQCQLNVRESGSCVLGSDIYIVGGLNGDHYFSEMIYAYNTNEDVKAVVEEKHSPRIGRACCILTLPQYGF
ncbi:kelch-like protein 26 [Lingula anatina]|uniref:Kelch-like protein 26 n=1 Tax=Lingula anatina TaxID=7574 RepID=A0A1S3JEH1_LINAN|nr:kelch-like protein 26 [Lingula anatina]XP_013408734.1 kelch-like protein 26 [Lingula anatina]|eukprot:XP_013408733.1 kelch-like protein 26 [Lingula anatina]